MDRALGRFPEPPQEQAETPRDEAAASPPNGASREEKKVSLLGDGADHAAPPTRDKNGVWIPPQYRLDTDVLTTIRALNKKGMVYFGESEEGAIAIPLTEMYHVIDVSSSGKGKSNRFRLAMMQLVNTCEVYYINPLAAEVKATNDEREIEVWKPLYDRLAHGQPIKEGKDIRRLMQALSQEIVKRNQLEEQRDFSWKARPIFTFIDELPEVYARCPEAKDLLDTIGRMGRQYLIFTWVASQTANVKDTGLSTATQAQYRTRIYGGGDKLSSERMMKGNVPMHTERTLQSNGEGLTLMLAEGMDGCSFVRAPLVMDEAMFSYLGLPAFNKAEWLAPAMRRRDAKSESPTGQETHAQEHQSPREQVSPKRPVTVKQWGGMTIETILALHQAGALDEQGMLSLIELLPTQQRDEEEMPQASQQQSAPTVPEASRALKVLPFPGQQDGKGKSSLAERKASRLERLRHVPTSNDVRQPYYGNADEVGLEEARKAWFEEVYTSGDKLMRRFPGLTKYQAGKLRDWIIPPR